MVSYFFNNYSSVILSIHLLLSNVNQAINKFFPPLVGQLWGRVWFAYFLPRNQNRSGWLCLGVWYTRVSMSIPILNLILEWNGNLLITFFSIWPRTTDWKLNLEESKHIENISQLHFHIWDLKFEFKFLYKLKF